MKKFAVIGSNTSLSKSPQLFTYIFKKLKIPAEYSYIEIKNSDKFIDFFKNKEHLQYDGLNITLPFKSIVGEYCNSIDVAIAKAFSLNCIKIKDGSIRGYNTDILGFERMINNNNILINNYDVLILGSGGSAASVIYSLLSSKVKKIFILSKNTESANILIRRFNTCSNTSIQLYNSSICSDKNVLINCTPIGVIKNTNSEILKSLRSSHFCIDLNYINRTLSKSIFSKYADYYINGLEMFIFQALGSLDIWYEDKLSDKLNFKELIKEIKND